jgi:hypothetical protein
VSGFGNSPLGASPYGLGTPSTAAGNAGSPLTDATGAGYGSRYINPATRQYEFDANGRIKGMPDVASMVQLVVQTTLGTSAVSTLGDSPPGGVIGRNYAQRRTQSLNDALASLVAQKLIAIVSITVDTTVRPITAVVTWRDLTTQTEHELSI